MIRFRMKISMIPLHKSNPVSLLLVTIIAVTVMISDVHTTSQALQVGNNNNNKRGNVSNIPTASTNKATKVIKVCQNKDCVKNFPSKYDGGLIQTMKDLIPPLAPYSADGEISNQHILIESSGCLSQCTNGPNICVRSAGNNAERVFGKVNEVQMIAAILDVAADIDSPGVLMAAVEDMAMANKAVDPTKKLKLLSRAITALEKVNLTESTAMAHALVLRADAYLELSSGTTNQTNNAPADYLKEALQDAINSLKIDDMEGRAWRAVADVKEANGDVLGAMEAVSSWASANPSMSIKAKRELQRLSQKNSFNP